VCVLAFGTLAVLMIALGPQLLRLFGSQIGNEKITSEQIHVGWPLLALVAPQVVLYGIAGVAVAAQNAAHRFALAAAAPAVENLGVIATMAAVAVFYGSAPDLSHVHTGEIILLGAGSTAAVATHAAVQWWGAYRAGILLIPRPVWRDAELREVARLALPSLGLASLTIVRWGAMLVVAGGVAGGVVAVQLAIALLVLPSALGARPIATVTLPRLSRLVHTGKRQQFADEAITGVGLGAFLVTPVAVAYLALAAPIAHAVSFGSLSTGPGQHLLVLAIAACGMSALGDSLMVIASQASFALRDAVSPFLATGVRAVLGIGGMIVGAAIVSGPAVLVVIGISISVADLAAAAVLWWRLRRRMPAPAYGLIPPIVRALASATIMVGPAFVVAWGVGRIGPGHLVSIGALAAAVVTGAAIYLAAQIALRSPELRLLRAALRSARGVGPRVPPARGDDVLRVAL
jgi:putative peptidoglycan lipid II flippase